MKKFWKWTNKIVKNEEMQEQNPERTLFLNGTIADESWFDDDVTPQLFKEELLSGSGDITVWINSPGGDCVAAAQIYNMLMDYKGNVTVKIDGIAASAASVIAMAGNKVLMSPVSMLMIHNPMTVEGEREFKKSLAEINNSFKVLGSEMKLVFHPFNLNVNTRIIAMSFNPYNRREISIEVGDYRPSISDNLYQMEQKTNEIRKDVGESTAELKTATNSTDISVTEKSQRLFRITYNAIQATYAAFCSTVKFVISAAGTLAFILKKNENEVMRYEEYFSEGPHTKTYAYPFTSEVGQNTMSLSVVSADGAEGRFPKMQTWGYVMGAYLAGDTPWDGYIEAREDEVHFAMRRTVRKALVRTSDTLMFEILKSHKFKFSEPMSAFIKRERDRKTLEPTVRAVSPDAWSPKIITPPPITVVNVSNRKLYLELRNPVKAERIEIAAFTMIVTTEKETVRLQPISADFGVGEFGSTIWLAFGSSVMKDSVQSITLLYDGEVGNLTDVLNNAPCNSFQTSFIYTPYEEEET